MRRRFGFVDFQSSRDADDFIRLCFGRFVPYLSNVFRIWRVSGSLGTECVWKLLMLCVGVAVAGVDPAVILALDRVVGTAVVIGPIGPSTVSRLTICPAESRKSRCLADPGHFFTCLVTFCVALVDIGPARTLAGTWSKPGVNVIRRFLFGWSYPYK